MGGRCAVRGVYWVRAAYDEGSYSVFKAPAFDALAPGQQLCAVPRHVWAYGRRRGGDDARRSQAYVPRSPVSAS